MTAESILSVNVDTASFDRFQNAFNKYQKELAQSDSRWKNAGKLQDVLGSKYTKITGAFQVQGRLAKIMAEDEKKRLASTANSERLWASISKSSKSFASNVGEATKSILKWSTLIEAAGGLLGLGGLFGIGKMAATVGNERRSAQGLGLSIGQQKAFGINFGKLVDPDAYLGWINGMEGDRSKQQAAYGLLHHGLTGDTAADSVAMLDAIRSLAKNTSLPNLNQILGSYGVNLSPEEQRRLKFGSDEEYAGIKSRYAKDSSALNIPDDIAKKWQDFTTQIQEAGTRIFNVFVKGLAPLADPLARLSDGFVKFIETLSKSDLVGEAIDKLAKWLNDFSGNISAPDFLNSVKAFTSDIGDLAQAIHGVVHPGETIGNAGSSIGTAWDRFVNGGAGVSSKVDAAAQRNALAIAGKYEQQYGLPKGFLAAQMLVESGGNPNAVSSKGAMGLMQWMPGSAKEHGVNPMDALSAVGGSGEWEAALRKKYGNDLQKVLAAYNEGPGRVDQDIANARAHGGSWLKYSTDETRRYVSKNELAITIYNTTGGNAQATIAALGAQ